MKRIWIRICCVAVLALILSGCQTPEYLVGVWESEIDFVNQIADMLPVKGDMEEHRDELTLTVRLTFRKDGTYQMELDEAQALTAFQILREELNGDVAAYLKDMLQEQGLTISVEEMLESMGLSPETFSEQYLGKDAVRALVEWMNAEGNYRAKNSRLYLSRSLDTPVDEGQYETYVVSNNELRILTPIGPEMAAGLYPMVFRKVS